MSVTTVVFTTRLRRQKHPAQHSASDQMGKLHNPALAAAAAATAEQPNAVGCQWPIGSSSDTIMITAAVDAGHRAHPA